MVEENEQTQARKLNARWDGDRGYWFIPETIDEKDKKALRQRFQQGDPYFDKYDDTEYIDVKYSQKQYAKKFKARWDNITKSWYIPTDISQENKRQLRKMFGTWYF